MEDVYRASPASTGSAFGDGAEDEDDPEDEIRRSMEARGRQPNLSFFAFTATPKAKTLEVFGVPSPDGTPEPRHLYS
jgi:type I restriction enzyme R subunit